MLVATKASLFHVSGPYRCVGVQVSTHVLNLELQLVLGTLVGTLVNVSNRIPSFELSVNPYLESKVLQEVRGSVGLVSLCPATGIDPDTNGGGLSPWGVLSSDLNHVSEFLEPLRYPFRVP